MDDQGTSRAVCGVRFRKLRIAWSLGCGIACVLVIALWARSTQISDRLHGRLWGNRAFVLSAKQGYIATVVFSWTRSPNWWELEKRSSPVEDELSFPVGPMDQYIAHLGFGWINRPTYIVDLSRKVSELTAPPDRGLPVFKSMSLALVNSGVISWKVSLPLNGAGPLMPMWFLVLLTSTFATLPWIRQLPRRFTLRTLLIATTLVAVVLGLAVYALRK